MAVVAEEEEAGPVEAKRRGRKSNRSMLLLHQGFVSHILLLGNNKNVDRAQLKYRPDLVCVVSLCIDGAVLDYFLQGIPS